MRNTLMAAALVATQFATPALAQEGNWLVRLRAVHIATENKSEPIPTLAVPTDAIHVSDEWIPEVDVTYFFTKNLAAELVLTYPQRHTVNVTASAVGAFEAGHFRHLPPTLSLQYHFNPDGALRPYIGAGINYTRISSVSLRVPGVTTLSLEKDSVGLSVGGGIDIRLAPKVFLNFDLKKVQIEADVSTPAARVSKVKLDPWLFGIGLGYRF